MRRFLFLVICLAASPAFTADLSAKPKFGPEATPILGHAEFLKEAPAPDYWALSPFYVPQETSSDCSAAAAVMALNALRGLPAMADKPILTKERLFKSLKGNSWGKEWQENAAEDGPGVTFGGFNVYLDQGIKAAGLSDVTLLATKANPRDPSQLDRLRRTLAANEASARDVVLVYFNQGVVTGDWNGPHISPVGAYDEAHDRVLIMDVDRDWYVPYWTSTATLLAAMAKPAPATKDMGPLAGETGGYYILTRE